MSKIKTLFITMGAENLGVEALIAMLLRHNSRVALLHEPAFFADLNSVHFPKISRYFSITPKILKEIERIKPDIIGLSSMTDNYRWNIELARRIKELYPEIKIVMGGIHPTLVPEIVISEQCIDFVIRGEADHSIIDLISALETGKDLSHIPGLYFKINGDVIKSGSEPRLIEDLDSLPFLHKDLFYDTGLIPKDIYRTCASRGCPYNCSYCCNEFIHRMYKRPNIRFRSVNNVIYELINAKKRYKPKAVHFNDDIFTYKVDWLIAFFERYTREIGLPYSCLTHPKFINEDVARLLKDSGCYRVQVGVQTLNEKLKRKYFNRYERNDEIEKALETLDKHKITFTVDHIIGLPNQEIEELIANSAFYTNFKSLKMVNVYLLSFYPQLSIIDKIFNGNVELRKQIEERISKGKSINCLSGFDDEYYKGKNDLKKAELILLSAGAVPTIFHKKLVKAFKVYGDKLYFLRYIFYLISILNIPEYSWISYMKNYAKNSPLLLLRNILDQIKLR